MGKARSGGSRASPSAPPRGVSVRQGRAWKPRKPGCVPAESDEPTGPLAQQPRSRGPPTPPGCREGFRQTALLRSAGLGFAVVTGSRVPSSLGGGWGSVCSADVCGRWWHLSHRGCPSSWVSSFTCPSCVCDALVCLPPAGTQGRLRSVQPRPVPASPWAHPTDGALRSSCRNCRRPSHTHTSKRGSAPRNRQAGPALGAHPAGPGAAASRPGHRPPEVLTVLRVSSPPRPAAPPRGEAQRRGSAGTRGAPSGAPEGGVIHGSPISAALPRALLLPAWGPAQRRGPGSTQDRISGAAGGRSPCAPGAPLP